MARYAAALRAAAKSTGPVRFAITGLILTPVSVMARAIPADAAADDLAAWTETRQHMKVTDVRVTEVQIVRWQYTTTGMTPIALASASP